ncbi:fasciclin domain-containing protein [Sphingobacterium kyonggiense]
MKNPLKNIIYYFLFLIGFCLYSCKHEDLNIFKESENLANIIDFSKNNYELTLFHAALNQVGLTETLTSEGPYTFFAPSNKAFNDIGVTKASDFASMDQDSLKMMLSYHILPRRLNYSDVPPGTIDNKYTNLANLEVYLGNRFFIGCSTCTPIIDFYINGASIQKLGTDIPLTNGVLHVINKVLKYKPSVQDILLSKEKYSFFVQFLKQMRKWDELSESGPFTIFAPTNDAFLKEKISLEQIKSWNPSNFHNRFWSVYLVYNHFFLSDMDVFGRLPGSGYYGAPYYKSKIRGDENYSFGISTESPRKPFIIDNRKTYQNQPDRESPLEPISELDYKAENGIVNGISNLLVLPTEAKIDKNQKDENK